jgi:flagellar protein FlaG
MNIAAIQSLPMMRTAERSTESSVQRAVSVVSEMLSPLARGLEFSVDEGGEMVVRVIDRGTNEVLRQIPSREMLAIARALDRMQGLLIRERA